MFTFTSLGRKDTKIKLRSLILNIPGDRVLPIDVALVYFMSSTSIILSDVFLHSTHHVLEMMIFYSS